MGGWECCLYERTKKRKLILCSYSPYIVAVQPMIVQHELFCWCQHIICLPSYNLFANTWLRVTFLISRHWTTIVVSIPILQIVCFYSFLATIVVAFPYGRQLRIGPDTTTAFAWSCRTNAVIAQTARCSVLQPVFTFFVARFWCYVLPLSNSAIPWDKRSSLQLVMWPPSCIMSSQSPATFSSFIVFQ